MSVVFVVIINRQSTKQYIIQHRERFSKYTEPFQRTLDFKLKYPIFLPKLFQLCQEIFPYNPRSNTNVISICEMWKKWIGQIRQLSGDGSPSSEAKACSSRYITVIKNVIFHNHQ